MIDETLTKNLSFLCSHYQSIAEVCRKLSINRQQFNKYLAGQSRPSRHNMRRICDFFGVTESEILLESARFEELVAVRRRPLVSEEFKEPFRHLEKLYHASGSLERYEGYYYRYFYAFGYPGKITKSLCVIYERDGKHYWKNLELMRSVGTGQPHTSVAKYVGCVLLISDRLYIMEYESHLQNSISLVTLYPSYRSRVDQLIGVQTGGPVRRGRKPAASRVLLDYLGRHIDLRRALNQCGVFESEDPRIPSEIGEVVRNKIVPGSYVLEVEEP